MTHAPREDLFGWIDAKNYDDVFIIPKYSEITTREEVNTSTMLGAHTLQVPVISANMDSVTSGNMAIAMWRAGAIGAMHRFLSVQKNIEEYVKVKCAGAECIVSVGVGDNSKERTDALYATGARSFVIDIAHGHSKMVKDMLKYMKHQYHDLYVIAGNVATPNAMLQLVEWGADCVKVGLSNGFVCLTKNVTGVMVPQFDAVYQCAQVDRGKAQLIADGGVKEIGDIAKALGVGADAVMCGSMFAGCDETPGERFGNSKVYRGMASRDAMQVIRNGTLPTPEGRSTMVDCIGPAKNIVGDIGGGLRSTFSYCNARNLQEFREKVQFGTKY